MANLININRTPLSQNGGSGRWYILDDNSTTISSSWGTGDISEFGGSISWDASGGPGGVGPVYNSGNSTGRPRGGYTDDALMLGEYDFSIGAWVYFSSSASSTKTILERTDTNTGYSLSVTGAINNINLFIDSFNFSNTTAYNNTLNAPYTFSTGQWYSIMWVIRRTSNPQNPVGYFLNGTAYCYVNGSLQSTIGFSNMFSLGGSLSILNIGTRSDGGDRFQGLIRDVYILKTYNYSNNSAFVNQYSKLYD